MPVLLFTAGEVAGTLIARQRDLSRQILELAELDPSKGGKPLDPGESVAARHHKIAKLGKQLAEGFSMLDTLMRNDEVSGTAATEVDPEPAAPDTSQAN